MNIAEIAKKLLARTVELPYAMHELALVDPKDVPFTAAVRAACERNACGCYGKYWTCPPAVGDWEERRDHFRLYRHALLYTTKHDLEDSFDVEGMAEGHRLHGMVDDAVFQLFSAEEGAFELLGAEGCRRCKACTYPTSPCRFPEKLRVPVESVGIDVVALSKAAGVHYMNGVNTVTYFSMVFYDLL